MYLASTSKGMSDYALHVANLQDQRRNNPKSLHAANTQKPETRSRKICMTSVQLRS